jgi:MFS family permease
MSVVNETLNMGFIIAPAECDLALTYQDKGMLNGVAFLGIVLSSHFWGYISDFKGRRNVMLASCLGSFLFSVLSSFSTHVIMLIVTRFFVGFL